jgi:hypothetical protein
MVSEIYLLTAIIGLSIIGFLALLAWGKLLK